MYDFEITKREVLVSIAIIFLMLATGFLISGNIASAVEEKNEIYHKALKIEDEDMYNHAKSIGVGNAFTYFSLDAVTPQSIERLAGEYLYIERIYEEEHYKSRTVTKKDANGKEYQKTEWYWEWDHEKTDYWESPTVIFNGEEYPTNKFTNLPTSSHGYDYISIHKRYKYYTTDIHLEGSAYLNFGVGSIDGKVYLASSTTVQDLYQSKLGNPTVYTVVFWIVWIILTGFLVFGFYYLDNYWLEDNPNGGRKRRYRRHGWH